VEVLPMPTDRHQMVVGNLFLELSLLARAERGTLRFAPLRVRLWPGKFREPDLVYMAADHQDRIHEQFWDRADLVVEVVSPDDAERDRVHKRREYAEAGIPEFWLVDLESETVTVLRLHEGAWQEHGVFARGAPATSATYPSLQVDVDAVFGRR
jgi:Uma2 family endonuclease